MKNGTGVVAALLVGLGLALGGWFIGDGFLKGRAADRYVTVKGVSERVVTADVALWPLRFVSTDDDLNRAQEEIKKSHERILAFLQRHGIDAADAEVQRLDVTDRLADPYRSGSMKSRYIISQTVMVRSSEPETIAQASQAVGELVDAGVVLSSNRGPYSGPTFLFTRLSELKPDMIAEATAKARRGAEQFAQDSGSRIGGIRRANQGVFVIQPRDKAPGITEGSQLHKKVRVVSTVAYYLKD
ncbi:MAG: SIMPL domain-containing protein [Desulfobacteraceae bacterium]|jgi:hypothetical protein